MILDLKMILFPKLCSLRHWFVHFLITIYQIQLFYRHWGYSREPNKICALTGFML